MLVKQGVHQAHAHLDVHACPRTRAVPATRTPEFAGVQSEQVPGNQVTHAKGHHVPHGKKPHRLAVCAAMPTAPDMTTHTGPGLLESQLTLLPGVTSPALLRAYWRQACRPRLDALLRTASAMSARPALLPVVDQLIHELKQVSVPASHWASRHEDDAWCQAAAEVAADCKKYEEYVFRNRGLHAKLCAVQERLASALSGHASGGAQHQAQEQQQQQHQQQLQQQQQQPPQQPQQQADSVWSLPLDDGQGRSLSPAQLHRLASLLRAAFEGKGVRVEDGLSDLAASHSPGTLDAAWDDARQLMRQERAVAGRVRAVLTDVRVAPVLRLADIPWRDLGCGHPTDSAAAPPSHQAGEEAVADATVGTDEEEEGEEEGVEAPPWLGDAMLERLVARTPLLSSEGGGGGVGGGGGGGDGVGGWGDAVLLDRVATQELVRRHPLAEVRQAAWQGVARRTSVMLQLMTQQAQIRSRLAKLNNQPTFVHMMQPPGACATGGPQDVLQLLQALAASSQAPASLQVQHMLACATATGHPLPPAPALVPPHDVAFLHEHHMRQCGLTLTYPEVSHLLTLTRILQGLSELLGDMMGISLHVQHLPTSMQPHNTPCEAAGNQQGDAESMTWGQDVVVLRVMAHQHPQAEPASAQAPELAGFLFIDPGGAYGARQLRFSRRWGTVAPPPTPMGSQSQSPGNQGMSHPVDQGGQQGVHPGGQSGQQEGHLPVVSLGLQWQWSGGEAGSLEAVWELMHEVGHGLHLIMSSRQAAFHHWAGRYLPLDLLEVPSMLFEKFLTSPHTLQRICGCDSHTAAILAQTWKAKHHSALDFQDQLLVALADQLTGMGGDATTLFPRVVQELSSLPHVPCTLKRLSCLPVASHHSAYFWVYSSCFVAASRLWDSTLGGAGPCSRHQGWRVRLLLLEAGAQQDPRVLLADVLDGHAAADQEGVQEGFANLSRWLWVGTAAAG